MSVKKQETVDSSGKKIEQKKKKTPPPKGSKEKQKINDLNQQLVQNEDRHLRLIAEFDNYRRRKKKEITQMLQYEGKAIFEDLLPIIDDLDRLAEAFNNHNESDDGSSIKEGVQLIQAKMGKFLEDWKIEPYGTPGEILDLDVHDAIMTQKEKGKKEDEILQVFQKGYTYKDKVVRHAKVIVNKK